MKSIVSRRQIETVLAAALAATAAIIGLGSDGRSGALGPKFLALEKVGRFNQPVHLSQPPGPDAPLYVAERPGTVRTVTGGAVASQPFLDIRRKVKTTGKGGEQGMLSIAFPADHAESGYFYVAYTDHRNALRVAEFRRSRKDPARAAPGSERLVLRIPQPTAKHHGGLLLFGPDGHLYIGSGDGGPSGDPNDVAQNKRLLLGKLLRIDPRPRPPAKGKGKRAAYRVPRDNPLVGRPGRDEIFAYGLRNPWRFSFDRGPAGDLVAIADVGDRRYEEINILPLRKARGANFGWPAFEGTVKFKGGVPRDRTVEPIHVYPHGRRCSVIGGHVIRDPRLSRIKGREVLGSYLFGDFCTERLFAFRPKAGKAGRERSFRFKLPAVTSFGEDRAGRIYVLTYEGPAYRIDPRRKQIE